MTKKIIASLLLLLPAAVLAFNPGGVPNAAPGLSINSLVDIIFSVIWPVAVAIIIIGGVIVAFLFFNAQGDPEKLRTARLGVIGLFIVSALVLLAWSIPFIVRNTIGNGI